MAHSAPFAIGLFAGIIGAACGSSTSEDASGTGGQQATGGAGTGGSGTGAAAAGGSGAGGGGPVITPSCPAAALPTAPSDCALTGVLCVAASAGPTQEYATIQAAADAAAPGDTVLVQAGSYAGFQIDGSGSAAAPISYIASGAVSIDTPASTGDGIRIQNASHVRVIGFSVHDTPQRCIAARGATPDQPMVGVWVVGNHCARSGVEGFYLSELAQSHVELNDIHDSGMSGDTRSHGFYLANAGSDDTTICGNVIGRSTPAESNGIHFNGDLSVGGDGIISGLVVQSNVIYGHAQNGLNLDGVERSVFVNNVVYGNARNALRAYAIDAAAGPRDLVIVNNTFVTGATGGWPLKLSEDLGGHLVWNNVLLSDNPNTGSIALAPSPGFQSSHNVVVDRFTNDDEASSVSLAEWQALGFDAGSFVATPAALFSAPASGDFSLLAGAPAIDAGIAAFQGQPTPSADIAGTPRPSGAAVDIGAYEAP